MVVRGRSKWRALSEAETEVYGASRLRRLYGCVFNMLHAQSLLASGGIGRTRSELEAAGNEQIQEYEQLLLTWSQVHKSRVWLFYFYISVA
jgi:hypothetical protein